MKRRYKALIAIIIPIIIIYSLKYTNDEIYRWLMGYMFAITLLFKSSILSLWFASKLKILAFIKGLTIFQGFVLLIKRWLLDNVIAVWIREYIIDNIKEAFIEIKEFYIHLNIKAKLTDTFKILFIGTIITIITLWLGYFDKLFVFAQIKMIANGIFQAILTFGTKLTTQIISWFASSWMAPILEVFALSYILSLIEKIFGTNNPLSRVLNFIGDKLNELFYYLGIFKQKHIDPLVECKVVSNSKKFNDKLKDMIQNKKILEEYRYFEKFENMIMKGHIDAYYSFNDMHKIKDKKELYSIINQKTKDNIEIVAYVSRNSLGILLEEDVPDSYYHDIFLLESFASHQKLGVKTYQNDNPHHIDHTDFWILNTSRFPVTIGSKTDNFKRVCIMPHGLKMIKTDRIFNYEDKDIYAEYNGIKVYFSAIVYE